MLVVHDMYRKSVAYEGSARIPCLLHIPPALREGWGEGGEVDAIAELRDVMPTLLDAAGVQIPESVDGRSLRPALAARETVRELLHGETLIGSMRRHSMDWILSQRY